MKAKDILVWGGIAVGVYLLYRLIGIGSGVASAVGSGLQSAGAGIANLWVSLTSAPAMNVLGTVQYPNGSTAPISTIPVKIDSSGNIYTNSNGITYQLQPWVADANGNPVYPLVAVGT